MATTKDPHLKPGAVTVQQFGAQATEPRLPQFAEGSAPRQLPHPASKSATSASGAPPTRPPSQPAQRIVSPVAPRLPSAPQSAGGRPSAQGKPAAARPPAPAPVKAAPAKPTPPKQPPRRNADIIDMAKSREQRDARAQEAGRTLLALVPPLPAEGSPRQNIVHSGGGGGAAAAVARRPAAQPRPEIRPPPPEHKPFAEYEALGLPEPRPAGGGMQKLIVSTYRMLGFAILSIIVIVLVGYIGTSAFYFVSDSWVQPMVVSPTDERVLQLKSELAEQASARDQVMVQLQHTDRFIASQQDFQEQFVMAVKADLAERKSSLGRVAKLARTYRGERSRIRSSNEAYAKQSKQNMSKEYEARLIARGDLTAGEYQQAQIANSNLSLAERQVEFENRAAELQKQSASLENILSKKQNAGALSYEVLKIKRDYDMSKLESAKATEERKALQASLERHNAIVNSIQQSPQLRASQQKANVAFVPYANFEGVKPGAPVYACTLEMVLCHEAGTIKAVLPGEVTSKHPHREKSLRGQMVELALDDTSAAEENVLFIGSKPLLF
jgi:hypothetical protein